MALASSEHVRHAARSVAAWHYAVACTGCIVNTALVGQGFYDAMAQALLPLSVRTCECSIVTSRQMATISQITGMLRSGLRPAGD